MKKILLTTICLAFATFSFSQQLSRYVVSSGGNYSTNGGYSNSSTIGESMVTTLTSASNSLTQGFQQSFNAPLLPEITISNPTDGAIFTLYNNIILDFTVNNFNVGVDGDGHIHYYVNGILTPHYDTTSILLPNLSNGEYQVIMALFDTAHQPIIPNVADTVFFIVNMINGCTDPSAGNYDSTATVDDGSCTSPSCSEDSPTGLYVDGIIHSRATINWDNMNSATCVVDQYRIKYREVGTTPVTQKTMGGPVGSCNYGNQRVDKQLYNLTGATTYEYQMKAWYCGGGTSTWTTWNTFTTADDCPNVGNFSVYGANPTKATFNWDASNGSYDFVRIKMRVDSISNPVGSDWFQVGGFGVLYGTYTKNKNGLVAGETYRAQARTFCDPNGGAYFSPSWSPLQYWTQSTTVRLEGGNAIANLDVYPNPSKDVFNISFTSEEIQDLQVRVVNVIGEELINESLEKFIGEYTKAIDLATYTKGIYFVEISTNNGIINKKMILQ